MAIPARLGWQLHCHPRCSWRGGSATAAPTDFESTKDSINPAVAWAEAAEYNQFANIRNAHMRFDMSFSRAIVLYVVLLASARAFAQADGRTLPKPLAGHPGNVFLAGEEVVVTLPAATPNAWQAVDYDGKVVAEGEAAGRSVWDDCRSDITKCGGRRAAGAERIASRWACWRRWPCPTPKTSPIGIDVAMAWSFPEDKMPAVASLCAWPASTGSATG